MNFHDWLVGVGTNGPGYSNGEVASNAGDDPLVKRMQEPIVQDSENSAIQKLADQLGIKLSKDTQDYLTQYYLQRKNDEWAYARQTQYDSERYQRTVADLKAAGLNPFLALQSLSPGNSSISSGSITSGSIASQNNSARQAGTTVFGAIGTVLAIIAAAIIHAM